jgi:hypothetical protein
MKELYRVVCPTPSFKRDSKNWCQKLTALVVCLGTAKEKQESTLYANSRPLKEFIDDSCIRFLYINIYNLIVI